MKEKRIRGLKVAPFVAPEVCVLDNHLRALQEAVSIGADMLALLSERENAFPRRKGN